MIFFFFEEKFTHFVNRDMDIAYNYYPPSFIIDDLRNELLPNQHVPGNLIIYTGRSSGARSVSRQQLLIGILFLLSSSRKFVQY